MVKVVAEVMWRRTRVGGGEGGSRGDMKMN